MARRGEICLREVNVTTGTFHHRFSLTSERESRRLQEP